MSGIARCIRLASLSRALEEHSPVIRVRRIAHATFETPEVERQIAYYTNVLGLALVEREQGAAYLASTLDHHSVVLKEGPAAQCTRLSFQVAPGTDIGELQRQLSGHGIKSERRSAPAPSIREFISFQDPKGTGIDVFTEYETSRQDFQSTGIVPLKLGHVAFTTTELQKLVEFYTQVLGFRISDWMGDFFVFMRCGPDHHTVNLVQAKSTKMHHIAFELRDWAHVQAACDHLSRHDIRLVWGPGRHGIGHNIFTYHRNPDGQYTELFTELDKMHDEELGYFEPRPWHRDKPQRPKVWTPGPGAANYWGDPPPAGFLE
jgi:catechol 2,3-dioxygenase-like lactoylglutathione lyase family enzyme